MVYSIWKLWKSQHTLQYSLRNTLSVKQTELSEFSFPKLPVIHVPHYLSITFKITFITWKPWLSKHINCPLWYSDNSSCTAFLQLMLHWSQNEDAVGLARATTSLSFSVPFSIGSVELQRALDHLPLMGSWRKWICYQFLRQQVQQNIPWDDLILEKT